MADRQAAAVKQAEADKQAAALKKAEADKLDAKNKAVAPPATQPAVIVPLAVNPVPAQTVKKDTTLTAVKTTSVDSTANNIAAVKPVKVAVPSIFSMADSTNYYFVINVSSTSANLSSSRFGVGQFNRANYTGSTIKHQLRYVGDNNQLIYVGKFNNLHQVKDYARSIVPLLPEIMKVPKDKYSFFIVTQENLDKLKNKTLLDSYVDYYQNNY